MDNKKTYFEKEILPIIFIAIAVLLTFAYFSYKIEISKTFLYKNETGEVLVDQTAKTIAYIILIGISILCMLICIYLKDKTDKLKIEQVFLIVASISCALMTISMPMSKGHDETIHGMRIYEYAEGRIISNGRDAYLEEGVTNALDTKWSYQDIIENQKSYSTNTKKINWGYRVATYSPINYLPQIIGVMAGRIFTDNSMIHLYLARIGNIIACITMCYFSIKIIPYGKNLLFILSCIPITIEGFSTLSADGMLVSASLLWISYILYLCNNKEKKIGKKEIILLTLNAIVIALSKTIYLGLLLLLLIIPQEKWKNKKQKIIAFLFIILLATALDVGWYFIGFKSETPTADEIEIVSEGKSGYLYIITKPIKYMQKLIYTILQNSGKYIGEIYGETIEWNEEIKINLFPYIMLIASIIVSIKGKEKVEFNKYQKFVMLFIVIAETALVFTSMFIAWSKPNLSLIEGVQGRYFMPFLPLIFFGFGKKFLDTKKVANIIANIVLIMQIFVVMELVIFHI